MHVPGIGNVQKKYAIWGLIGAGSIAGIVYLRRKSSAANSSLASGTAGTDTASTDTTGTDPFASYGTDPSLYDSAGYGGFGAGAYGTSLPPSANTLATNEEWMAQAVSDTPGNSGTVEAALAGVLGGLTVTSAQRAIFLEAVGINGQPPQGYPTPIKVSDTNAHPGSGGTGSDKVTVPDVKGWPADDAYAMIRQAGLKPHGPEPKKGEHLYIQTQAPRGGTSVIRGSAVRMTAKAGTAPVLKK